MLFCHIHKPKLEAVGEFLLDLAVRVGVPALLSTVLGALSELLTSSGIFFAASVLLGSGDNWTEAVSPICCWWGLAGVVVPVAVHHTDLCHNLEPICFASCLARLRVQHGPGVAALLSSIKQLHSTGAAGSRVAAA